MNQDFRNSVIITIHSEITQNGETERNMQEVRGEWVRKGENFFLRYTEPGSSSSTLVKWAEGKDEVWVTRQGSVQVRQHFLPKVELFATYTTPYGRFSLRTFTQEIHIAAGEDHGMLQLSFLSQFNDSTESEHKLTILYRMLS